MPVKKKTVRNTPKLPKNVKINQKRKSQKKRGRRASRRQSGSARTTNQIYKEKLKEMEEEFKAKYEDRLEAIEAFLRNERRVVMVKTDLRR